jgi:glycosyltransferase involved in cell wall biosynthesis
VPRVRYVFVGDGPLREWLRADIHKRQLQSVVVLNGKEDDARLLYPAFDIVVQASESEGLPNVVLEAAAASLAIVATDVGGTSEVVTNETDGLLVPKGDADALTSAILRLAENPDLRERLGRAAKRRSGDFSTGQLTEKTAALYRRLLRERRRAS